MERFDFTTLRMGTNNFSVVTGSPFPDFNFDACYENNEKVEYKKRVIKYPMVDLIKSGDPGKDENTYDSVVYARDGSKIA